MPAAGDGWLKTPNYYVVAASSYCCPSSCYDNQRPGSATCPVIPQHICVVTQQQHNISAGTNWVPFKR